MNTPLPAADPAGRRRSRPTFRLRLFALLVLPAVGVGLVAWVTFDAYAARWIATHCRSVSGPTTPPTGESVVEYSPGLAAWFAPPSGRSIPTIVMVHGYGGERSDSSGFAAAMQQRGYGILRVDLACAHSAASYSGGTREADEISSAVRFAKQRTADGPVVLFGFSAGGSEAILAADRGAPVAAVITDSAPANLLNIVKDWHNQPWWLYHLTPRLFGVFSDNGHLTNLQFDLSERRRLPTLVIQGLGDTDVEPANGQQLASLTHGQLWLVPGANHGQSFDRVPAAYTARVTTFLGTVFGP